MPYVRSNSPGDKCQCVGIRAKSWSDPNLGAPAHLPSQGQREGLQIGMNDWFTFGPDNKNLFPKVSCSKQVKLLGRINKLAQSPESSMAPGYFLYAWLQGIPGQWATLYHRWWHDTWHFGEGVGIVSAPCCLLVRKLSWYSPMELGWPISSWRNTSCLC